MLSDGHGLAGQTIGGPGVGTSGAAVVVLLVLSVVCRMVTVLAVALVVKAGLAVVTVESEVVTGSVGFVGMVVNTVMPVAIIKKKENVKQITQQTSTT